MSDLAHLPERHIEKLKASDVYHEIFRTSPAAIAILTFEDERFVDVNEGFEQITGYRREDVLGRTFEEVDFHYHHKDRDSVYPELERGHTVRWAEGRVCRPNGTMRDVLGSFLPLEVGEDRYMAYKVVDITRLRMLEQEVLEAADHVQRHIGQELHDDVGQVLTGLSLLCETLCVSLEEDGLEEPYKRARKLHRLVEEVQVKMRHTIRGVLPLEIKKKGLVVALEHYTEVVEQLYDVSCTLHADETISVSDKRTASHLYRIAQEAAANAGKHSGADQITIELRKDGDNLLLRISDNGDGIPKEKVSGGFGLHTMRYRARMVGARLTIESRNGQGTVVQCMMGAGREG